MRNVRRLYILFFIISMSSHIAKATEDVHQSVMNQRVRFNELDSQNIPDWGTLVLMQSRFEEIRDARYVLHDGYLRGIPWRFPMDGCHTRAAMFIDLAVQRGYSKPKRAFIFGALSFKTPFIPDGISNPWFHTAPVVKVRNTVYVLDATIEFAQPLTIEEWALRMTPSIQSVLFAYCEGDTYKPTSNCHNPKPIEPNQLSEDTHHYLMREWNILNYLGFDPEFLLIN